MKHADVSGEALYCWYALHTHPVVASKVSHICCSDSPFLSCARSEICSEMEKELGGKVRYAYVQS